jgi:hypothetical protein
VIDNDLITVSADNIRLRIELDEARRERDEARKLACRGLALETYHAAQFIGGSCALTAEEIALERGWDCFEEKNHNA